MKNKMLDFVKSINGITYTGQKVISYPQIKKWYINPETSDTNKQILFYDLFEHKEITNMTNELMTMYNVKYINKYLDDPGNIFVERMRANGWIGVLLSRIVKSRRDCVSPISKSYYVLYFFINILYYNTKKHLYINQMSKLRDVKFISKYKARGPVTHKKTECEKEDNLK